jgi:biopolymer transport protein ExbB
MLHSLYEHFKEGGWGMWPIVLWVGVRDRDHRSSVRCILFKSSINKDAFLANIQKCILRG